MTAPVAHLSADELDDIARQLLVRAATLIPLVQEIERDELHLLGRNPVRQARALRGAARRYLMAAREAAERAERLRQAPPGPPNGSHHGISRSDSDSTREYAISAASARRMFDGNGASSREPEHGGGA